MKAYLLTGTALAIVTAANFSPAMANRLGPDDTRLSDWSDMLGQNGMNEVDPDCATAGAVF